MNLLDHLLEAAHEVGGIAQPRRRAAVERWLLEFSAVNVQLNALQAMVVAEQLARRYGYWAIMDERSWDRLVRVPLRTELEWSFGGMWPADFARPLAVPGSHGDEVALFLPEDVPGAALDERIEPVEHREVGPPEFEVPEFEDFAGPLGERERAMLGKVVELHGLVRWDIDLPEGVDFFLDLSDPEMTETYGGEIYFHLNISPLAAEPDIMGMVLRMTAELLLLYMVGALEDPECGEPEWADWASPLELELAVWLAARRLRLDVRPGRAAAGWLISPELPAPGELRWALVYDVADGVEGAMLGHRYQVND
jgi:hypothetical protein